MYIMYVYCRSVHLNMDACMILNAHSISLQYVFIFLTWKINQRLLVESRQQWWMSWLQFTACEHALLCCNISNSLPILWLCINVVCFVPLSSILVPTCQQIPQKLLLILIFQFQLLPWSQGLMNVAHITVTSKITPPFFPKEIHQAESASSMGYVIQPSGWVFVTEASTYQTLVRIEKDRTVLFLELL